jgi:hypothetical protein
LSHTPVLLCFSIYVPTQWFTWFQNLHESQRHTVVLSIGSFLILNTMDHLSMFIPSLWVICSPTSSISLLACQPFTFIYKSSFFLFLLSICVFIFFI